MPRPSLPMAASSASGPRSGSPPAAFMRVVRSGSSSSRASSIAFAALDRPGHDDPRMLRHQAAALILPGACSGEPRERAPSSNRLPPHAGGMRIGLFGGTFDPPHAAHRLASLVAMRRLGLDRVWWLVTPGNPLKGDQAPFAERLAAARAFARHPRIDVTGIE